MRWLLLAVAVAIGRPSEAQAGTRVVLMPVANQSSRAAASADAGRLLAVLLPRQGYDVVTGAPVERLLAARRVRYIDSVQNELLEALLSELDASAVVFATVLEYGDATPSAAFSARVVAAGGRTIGSAFTGLTPDDTTGPLGLGRIGTSQALLERAVERVVAMLPAAGRTSARDPAAHSVLHTGNVRTYRAPGLAGGETRRVCLLPLHNASDDRIGARVVADLLNVRMRGLGVLQAIPPAELRGALAAEGIHSLYELDPERLRALGRRLGSALFLRGVLREYRAAPARIDLEISVIDADKGRILWTSQRRAEGTEYSGVLQLGTIASPAILADQVVAEMLEALSRA